MTYQKPKQENKSNTGYTEIKLYSQNELDTMLYKQFQDLSKSFLEAVVQDNINLYHKFLHDQLTTDDFIDCVNKYGVNLEDRYQSLLKIIQDNESDLDEYDVWRDGIIYLCIYRNIRVRLFDVP